jgi:hypothetical protein
VLPIGRGTKGKRKNKTGLYQEKEIRIREIKIEESKK